jgi:hypothetical protein
MHNIRQHWFGLPLLLLFVLCTTFGCTEPEPESPDSSGSGTLAQGEVWSLSESPILEIGVQSGAEEYQLHRAESSIRLDDGTLIVANGGSRQLRFFDESGGFLNAVGGEGEGPGEFRFPSRIRKTGQDSLLVWDQSMHRISFFDHQGGFQGSRMLMPSAEVLFPGDEWMFGQFWVDSPVGPSARGPLREALAAIPGQPALGELGYVRVTSQGRLWVAETGPPSQDPIDWRVYGLDGSVLAAVTTPAHFEPHEIGPDYVLGRFRDDLDINFIRLYDLEKPDGSPAGPGLDPSPPASSPQPRHTLTERERELQAPVKAFLKNLASLEEIYYAGHYTYTADTEALFSNPRNRPPEELDVDILMAGERGWIVSVTHTESGAFCTIAYGAYVPMGWMAGELICP